MPERTICKAYRFRLYPTAEQEAYFAKVFGCCRYVYNHFLAAKMTAYEAKRGISTLDTLLEAGFSHDELARAVEVEREHFGFIHTQPASAFCRDMALLRDYRPVLYAAYWQWALDEGHVDRDVKVPSYYDTSKALTELKKRAVDYEGALFLYEADATALVYELRNLDAAYQNFFRRVKNGGAPGFPKFKSARGDRSSYKTAGRSVEVNYEAKRIKLPKVGWVKCVPHREVEGRIVSATVSLDACGRYHISLQCDGVPAPVAHIRVPEVGLELGVAELAVLSDGTRYKGVHGEEEIAKLERRLAREQQRLSRKKGSKKGEAKSNRYKKQQLKVARLSAKIAAKRKEELHRISLAIANDYETVYVHDDAVADELKKKGEKRDVPRFVERVMNKSLASASTAELKRQISYKMEWRDGSLVEVEASFPSTQTCSSCGYINSELAGVEGLKIREWGCPECGAHHDREINSAINVLMRGNDGEAGKK